jgi:hypothetical protein
MWRKVEDDEQIEQVEGCSDRLDGGILIPVLLLVAESEGNQDEE